MSALSKLGNVMTSQLPMLKRNFHVWVIVGSCAYVVAISVGALGYTAAIKNTVRINPFNQQELFEKTNYTRPAKLLPNPDERKSYLDDPPLKALLSEIYESDRWRRRGVAGH